MYGEILTQLPEGFVPYQQWPEYDLVNDALPDLRPRLIGAYPQGMRRGLWPLYIEEYVSDQEPSLPLSDKDPHTPPRLFVWRRLTRPDIPHGWWRLGRKASRLEGFASLAQNEAYTARWSESARRYRKKWLEEHLNKTHIIEQVLFEEFKIAYLQSTVAAQVRGNYLRPLAQRLAGDKASHVTLLAARDIKTKELHAGMAIIDSPAHLGSYYHCGFIRETSDKAPTMLGLMDYWFSRSAQKGFRFLHLGEFWLPGKPKHWKGFSLFKQKFGLYYIKYPPALVRLRKGKLF